MLDLFYLGVVMSRITVRLNEQELQALVALAEKERRHPRDQAAYIIRTALVQYGILKEESEPLTVARTSQSQCTSAR